MEDAGGIECLVGLVGRVGRVGRVGVGVGVRSCACGEISGTRRT